MRCSQYADAEIRRVGLIILEQLKNEAPLLFDDFEVLKLASGVIGLDMQKKKDEKYERR